MPPDARPGRPTQRPGLRALTQTLNDPPACEPAATSGFGTRDILRVILVILGVAAVLWMLYELEGVILLVVMAMFFAYLIAPLVEIVGRALRPLGRGRPVSRGLAIGCVYLLLVGSIGATGALILPGLGAQIADFGREAPGYVQKARDRFDRLTAVASRNRLPAQLRKSVDAGVTHTADAAGKLVASALGLALSIFASLPALILVPILAFFLLKDAESFRESALRVLPHGYSRWKGAEFFEAVNQTLAAYIRAQLMACVLIGAICTTGFILIGVPYALVLGIAAGLLEFIPLVGPLVIALMTTAVTSFHSVTAALVLLVFLGALRIVQDYVIYPRPIGRGIHLHPLAVILAVLSGAELGGIPGIFLAVPLVAVVDVAYRHWLRYHGSDGIVTDFLKPATPGAAEPPAPQR